jgi:hypothetical protein
MPQDSLKPDLQPAKSAQRGEELFADWIVLSLCTGILLSGLLLSPPNSDSPYLHIGRLPIPDTCSFRNLTGLPCPGCGLTRSIVAGLHGDFGASLIFHRLGLLTLAYIGLQFLYRLVVIFVPPLRQRVFGFGKILNRGMIVLIVLYVLNWGYTLLIRI